MYAPTWGMTVLVHSEYKGQTRRGHIYIALVSTSNPQHEYSCRTVANSSCSEGVRCTRMYWRSGRNTWKIGASESGLICVVREHLIHHVVHLAADNMGIGIFRLPFFPFGLRPGNGGGIALAPFGTSALGRRRAALHVKIN